MRIGLIIMTFAAMVLAGCAKGDDTTAQTLTGKLYVTIGEVSHAVTMEDNVGTRALIAVLQEGDITYTAHDYGGFEKVGALGQSFPTADHQITTSAGDLVLYNGDHICIFYGSNSWSYTRIGRLDNMSANEVRTFVHADEGDVSITLSLQYPQTGKH